MYAPEKPPLAADVEVRAVDRLKLAGVASGAVRAGVGEGVATRTALVEQLRGGHVRLRRRIVLAEVNVLGAAGGGADRDGGAGQQEGEHAARPGHAGRDHTESAVR